MRISRRVFALAVLLGTGIVVGSSAGNAADSTQPSTLPQALTTPQVEPSRENPPAATSHENPPARTEAKAPPSVRSVEVHPDRRVTFRLYAPRSGEAHVDCLGRQPMTRQENGVWSVTIGPLEPDVYSYSLTVDDSVRVPDSQNSFKKNPGEDLLEVPADPPAPWQQQDVPHGSIHIDWYPSQTLGVTRRVHVYTPPGYEGHPRSRYPVLYLLHGSGDDDANWTNIGCANRIMDNLIAQGKAKPMVVVMPMGHVPGLPGEQSFRRDFPAVLARFQGDLLNDLMPYIDRAYRVRSSTMGRAIAGLSMGAIQSQAIALQHPGRFGSVGLMSGAGAFSENLDAAFINLKADPTKINREFRLIYISVGKSDRLLPPSQRVDSWLTQHRIRHIYHEMEGSHEWKVWRHSLVELAPLLYR